MASGRVIPSSVPLVESTPRTRGSRCVATSSARASPLKVASTMWCGLRPDEHAHVQVHARLVHQREQEVVDQLDVEAADLRLLDASRRRRGTAGPTGRRPSAPAPRRAAPWPRRSGGCRPCRRAPRATPGRAPARRPRPCGGSRPRDRRGACTVRSKKPWRANSSSMWSRNGMPVLTVVSAVAVELQLEADVGLLRLARHRARRVPWAAPERGEPVVPSARSSHGAAGLGERPPAARRPIAASRRSTERACASSPSSRARRATAGPSRAQRARPAPR